MLKSFQKYCQNPWKIDVWEGSGMLWERLGSILEPRWRPRSPRGAPRGAKKPNIAPRWANLAPRWDPKFGKKTWKIDLKIYDFFCYFFDRILERFGAPNLWKIDAKNHSKHDKNQTANAMGENSENVHGVEARMKKSMFRQVPKLLKIEGKIK